MTPTLSTIRTPLDRLASETASGSADGSSATTAYAYDPAGNLLSATDAAGFATTYAYDLLGRRIASTDPLGNVTHTAYDGADRSTAMSFLGLLLC